MPTQKNKIITLLLILLLPGLVHALASDKEQPIYIEADRVNVDDKKGVSTYRGNVSIKQGTMRLKADSAVVHNNERGLNKVIVVGKPATFRQRPDNEPQDIHAEALRMEYFSSRERLYLINQARLTKGSSLFTGSRITYDTLNHVIKARKGEKNPKERVHITLEPKKTNKK